jgi:dTDP-glucose 4,6-dehydratase
MGSERVLVIGSNSFSGASFIRHLLDLGLEVVGISRSGEPIPAFLPYAWGNHDSFAFNQLDLNGDLDRIVELVRESRPSLVFNFASQSMVAQSWQHPEDWFQTNVVATVRLHDQLRRFDFIDRYVHISTPEVYGDCTGSVREDAPLNPTTPYAVSRAACDMSLMTFHKAYSFPVVFTRAANVYGPGQQLYRIIPRTILSILTGRKLPLQGGGKSVRSFIHIRDVAAGTWLVATKGRPGEIYHLSTERLVSIHDLVKMICERLDANFESCIEIVGERLGKDAAYILDNRKARETLGWDAAVDLESGIDETIAWVKKNFEGLKSQSLDYVHKR